jgi:hypothetical protein
MARNKQHHYVPSFYLGRFADSEGQVSVLDKSSDRVFRGRPETLAKEGAFYELPTSPDPDPLFLEDSLADLESEAANITACWLRQIESGGTVSIPSVNREIMSTYIAVQALRTSEQRALVAQAGNQSRTPTDTKLTHLALLLDSCVAEIAAAIHDSIWIFGRNDSGVPFWTSDHPVAVRRHPGVAHDHRCIHVLQLPCAGSEVLLPLSPTRFFYAYERTQWEKLEQFDGLVSPVQFTATLVQADNGCQVGHSRRFIFSDRDDFGFARQFCAENPIVRDPDRERFV